MYQGSTPLSSSCCTLGGKDPSGGGITCEKKSISQGCMWQEQDSGRTEPMTRKTRGLGLQEVFA